MSVTLALSASANAMPPVLAMRLCAKLSLMRERLRCRARERRAPPASVLACERSRSVRAHCFDASHEQMHAMCSSPSGIIVRATRRMRAGDRTNVVRMEAAGSGRSEAPKEVMVAFSLKRRSYSSACPVHLSCRLSEVSSSSSVRLDDRLLSSARALACDR